MISYVPVDFNNLQKTTFKLKPNISISTGNKRLKEGSKIEFILAEDFWYKKQFFPKGTKVNAQVEIILPNSKMGFPSTLEIGNFQINNEKIDANLTKDGANRTIWLAPTIYITSLFFFVGLLLIPIKGGHAKLYKNKIYTVNANIIE